MPSTKVKPSEMQVGDVVNSADTPWSTAIVQQIHDGQVHLYRPYAGNHGCIYSNNSIICYMGVEEYSIPIDYSGKYDLLERRDVERTHKHYRAVEEENVRLKSELAMTIKERDSLDRKVAIADLKIGQCLSNYRSLQENHSRLSNEFNEFIRKADAYGSQHNTQTDTA